MEQPPVAQIPASLAGQTQHSSTSMAMAQQPAESPLLASGILATTPPFTDTQTTMQRADEINTIQRMFSDKNTSAVALIGSPGAGKSTLATLLYRRLQLAKRTGMSAPHHMVWLTIGTYTTIPDIIAAILTGVGMHDPGLFLLKPEQQISSLLRALRRPHDNVLVILDQFENLLHPETNQGSAGRGTLPLFLELLQQDLGSSRILLTSYNSPFEGQNQSENPRVRSYLVSRISIPEGLGLLRQRGVEGEAENLSAVWQRCSGHVYDLVLFSALTHLSHLTANLLLEAPEYKPMWSGDVTNKLIIAVYHFLNPTQNAIVHALSLFHEPTPKEGVIMTITGNTVTFLHQNNNDQAIRDIEQELGTLTQLGLIQPSIHMSGLPSFSLHPLFRQHIIEHFFEDNSEKVDEGESPQWNNTDSHDTIIDMTENRALALANGHIQVAAYYKHVMQYHCPPYELRKGPYDIEPIISTIRHLCQGERWQSACSLLFEERLHESMVQWGAWNTLIGLYTAMLPPFGKLRSKDEGTVASHVGMLYGRVGEHQQSKIYFTQALTIQQQIADAQGEAVTLTNQGELLRLRGEDKQAHENFERALSLNQQFTNAALYCVIQHNLGLLYHQERNYQEAQQKYTAALHLAYSSQNEQYQGMILTNLGMLLYEQHQQNEALALLFAALDIRQRIQDPTVLMLERFLVALEQKIGQEKYDRLSNEVLEMQPRVFSRFVPTDMRQ
ncbi:MAG TPA: tetratricopeptide repeat protein [Dictyobacter sp.]|jgi:tetratricopeptide (TPR) repeat protein|nr:tetratricopeptide repeat protein [Dictyobacter sp.]